MLRRRLVVLAAATGAVAAVLPVQAALAAPIPVRPHDVHVTWAGSTSFTATLKAAHATRFRMFASTTRSNVYTRNISKAHRSAWTSGPSVTIHGLPYTSAPYYYRFEVKNAYHLRWDLNLHVAGLRPPTPTDVQVSTAGGGVHLTWNSGASGFTIAQATNSAMTKGRRIYTIHGPSRQFTPYGLHKGTAYYFRVRALNALTPSTYTPAVHATAGTAEQHLTMATYNIMEGRTAGGHEGGNLVPSWAKRRSGVARLIKQSNADVVAVQEAADWAGRTQGYGGTRQVDDLRKALGGTYALAHTEVPPSQHGYFRTGNYILYKTSTYKTVDGNGFWWQIGSSRLAVWQELENRATHARILVVCTHLTVGSGAANDRRREAETKNMVARASVLAAVRRVPVIYAGDFNSDINRSHAFDGPGIAMRAKGIVDTQKAAQTRHNAKYDSSNLYERTPPAFGQSIDYIYAPPGIGVQQSNLLLNLSHGRFVGTIPSDHNLLQAKVTYPY